MRADWRPRSMLTDWRVPSGRLVTSCAATGKAMAMAANVEMNQVWRFMIILRSVTDRVEVGEQRRDGLRRPCPGKIVARAGDHRERGVGGERHLPLLELDSDHRAIFAGLEQERRVGPSEPAGETPSGR